MVLHRPVELAVLFGNGPLLNIWNGGVDAAFQTERGAGALTVREAFATLRSHYTLIFLER